jgi:replicative DNA helicase
LSDLRESGSIEQDADIVGFVYRESMFDDTREDLKGLADLIVKKNRDGPVATIPLIFLEHQVRFENRAEDVDEEHAA